MSIAKSLPSVAWQGNCEGRLVLLDQTLLPQSAETVTCSTIETLHEAIRALRVRGAPAIGIAAAYGAVLALQPCLQNPHQASHNWPAALEQALDYLATSRPTAVNLFWALQRMRRTARQWYGSEVRAAAEALLQEARAIHEEDRQMCRAIGRHGAALLPLAGGVLTHCNTGGLATAEYGTALSAIFTAHDQGRKIHVFVDETRPLLQGARLTAWELAQHGVPATLICDSMAAQVMREGRVQAVIVGADRIAANGDTANKIGTYSVAVLAQAHAIPFYVAAPSSTFDLTLTSGDSIPIEQRSPEEITHLAGRPLAPPGTKVYNPAFDVTPARFIAAIITERGPIQPVTAQNIAAVLGPWEAGERSAGSS